MKRICSWCGKYMGYKPGKGTTHGICPPCAQNVRDQIKYPAQPAPKSALERSHCVTCGVSGIRATLVPHHEGVTCYPCFTARHPRKPPVRRRQNAHPRKGTAFDP